jgi:hypothetical protein
MITRHACESRRAGKTPGKPFKNEVGWELNMYVMWNLAVKGGLGLALLPFGGRARSEALRARMASV